MDETTPLLPERNDNDHHDEDLVTTPRASPSSRIFIILIWSSIIISALSFVYSLTILLVVRLSPYFDYINWQMRNAYEVLPLLVCTLPKLRV